MEINFDVRGNLKQELCVKHWLDETTIDIVYGGSKGSGKSFLGCSLILGDALIYPGTHYFIARKKLNDLRKFTIPSIYEVLDLWGITEDYYTYNGQDSYFEFYNKSKVFLIDAKYLPSDPNYTRFGSMQMTRGWIEEAGEFEEPSKNNLHASIGRWKNKEYNLNPKLLQTCNPVKNYLYSNYYKLDKDNTLEVWKKFIQALPSDNKMLPLDYIPNLLKILTENEIQRLVYGNWEYDDNPFAMFNYDDICNVFTNSFVVGNGKRYLSADIAYMGADLFVITIWNGFVVEKVIAIDKIDETAIGAKLIELAEKYSIPYSNIVYDSDGLRRFTANSLKKLTASKPFVNNAAPIKNKNYKNLKAECIFLLKEKVEANEIFIKDNEFRKQIIFDLENICRNQTDDEGKISIESKKLFKERTGKSFDFLDSLLMRMYFEIKNVGGWG